MGPSGIREEKSKWGQSGEIRMLGFRRLFSKTQTEHVSPSPGLPEKTTAEQLNDLAQHLHQCATVSHRHRCVSSSSVSSDGKWSRGSCWQISAPLTGLTWWCILMNVKSKLKSDSLHLMYYEIPTAQPWSSLLALVLGAKYKLELTYMLIRYASVTLRYQPT